jgi:alpha-L-fucosidase
LNGAQVLDLLADAFAQKSNLTINTAPLPDGSLHPADVSALRETGESIRKNGFPAPMLMDRSERKKVKRK